MGSIKTEVVRSTPVKAAGVKPVYRRCRAEKGNYLIGFSLRPS